MLTVDRLKELFSYDHATGQFIRIAAGGIRATRPDRNDTLAGTINAAGYVVIAVEGTEYFAHRLAWLYMKGVWPDENVDHRDGVKSNNVWLNLRACNQSQNGANAKLSSANTSSVKGVSMCKSTGRWRAKIAHHGKTLHIGRFDTLGEAEAAFKARAEELFGSYVRQL